MVAGGGSGHEPFAAGYVGEGMLTAAVAGSIFASPPSSNIFHALKVVAEINGSEFSIFAHQVSVAPAFYSLLSVMKNNLSFSWKIPEF